MGGYAPDGAPVANGRVPDPDTWEYAGLGLEYSGPIPHHAPEDLAGEFLICLDGLGFVALPGSTNPAGKPCAVLTIEGSL